MKKTFKLQIEGKHPERVLDALKYDIRRYLKRERGKPLPADADYWDFDCRLGLSQETAQPVHVGEITSSIDALSKDGAPAFYLEILARPAQRKRRDESPDTPS